MTIWSTRLVTLPDHCEPQNDFLWHISSAFDTCIPTNQAFFSTLLGSLSILAWLFAQLPQIYKNYKLKSTAGLSIYFLVEWCLGDSTNLAGAVLTDQATWQVIVAAYYTVVDLILVFQFFYFTHYRQKIDAQIPRVETPPRPGNSSHQQGFPRSSARPVSRVRASTANDHKFPYSISPFGLDSNIRNSRPKSRQTTASSPLASPKTVLMITMILTILTRAQASPLPDATFKTTTITLRELIGQIVAWSSTALYLGSRLPQLHKNYKRQSTSGLSISLFIAAFFGNLFYSASLLTNPLAWGDYPPYGVHGWVGPQGSSAATYIQLASPFFLGSAGVLALDAAMAVQFWIYGEGNRGVKMIAVPDDDGQKHWERVSGWMRGFIPSPRLGPLQVPSGYQRRDDDERALLRGGEESRREYGGTSRTG